MWLFSGYIEFFPTASSDVFIVLGQKKLVSKRISTFIALPWNSAEYNGTLE